MREFLLNIVYGTAYVLNGFKSPIITSGMTPLCRTVSKGQEFELKEDISSELRKGIFVIEEYMGDRILLKRKDKRHDLQPGQIPIFEISVLDDDRFINTP